MKPDLIDAIAAKYDLGMESKTEWRAVEKAKERFLSWGRPMFVIKDGSTYMTVDREILDSDYPTAKVLYEAGVE